MNARIIELRDVPNIVQQSSAVLWFRGKQYQSLLYLHIANIASSRGITLQTLSVNELSFDTLQLQCSTAFLGQSCIYWMGNCSAMLPKKQELLLAFMSEYHGPHTLLFYALPDFAGTVPQAWSVIELKDEIPLSEIEQIVQSWYKPAEANVISVIMKHLYKQVPGSVSIESMLTVAMYARVLGSSIYDFLQIYGPIISIYQPSLSIITNHFFNYDANAFYKEWAKIYTLYQMPFWVVFWSDHVWRAHAFSLYMHKGERTNAYSVAKNRLPYTFTKEGWRTIKPQLLQRAHAQLYALDVLIKNGSAAEWIELFFTRWFACSI